MRKQNKRNIKKNRKRLNARAKSTAFRKLKANPNVHIFDIDGVGSAGVYMNPNKDGGVKATNKLNEVADYMKDNHTPPKGLKSGFELNPLTFRWEYTIEYLNSKMVCDEIDDNTIAVFMYLKDKNAMWEDEFVKIKWTNAAIFSMTILGFLTAAEATKSGKEFKFQMA